MGFFKEGFFEIINRYRIAWRDAWSIRKQLDPPKREEDELAFLPAHLELIETPLSATPKWGYRLIMFFFLITIIWAIVGHIDVVASTQGKTVLSGRSKTIKSLEDGGVRKIYVETGQSVKAGDPLIDLYYQGAEQDYHKYEEALKAAILTQVRTTYLLQAIDEKEMPTVDRDKILTLTTLVTDEQLSETEELIRSQYAYWAAQDAKLASAIRQSEAEYQTLTTQLSKLDETIEIAQLQVADYEMLMGEKGISKHAYFDKKQELIRYETERDSSNSRLIEIEENRAQHEKERELLTYELKQNLLDQRREAKENITQFSADFERAKERLSNTHVVAPVSGTVQELNVHTEGGVVSHAEPLMTIVPEEDFIEVETLVPNKDIGFIEPDQEVIIKIESFPYTRYGYLTGRVKSISHDAIEHEQLGLVYQAMVRIDEGSEMIINGEPIRLSAGMNVTAEIKIGERRVITYFLSPLQTKIEESMREN